MAEVQALGKIIKQIMTLFRQRRELEGRIQNGEENERDRMELEALNEALTK